ncbi:MAG: cobalamin B12-binding domain-containing protein, partial [Candidatus Kapabacteria bacterium]|nr:cobalamin B12-binding domain-containing protein [Candidatus Kapabacteria bacterium]
INYTAFLDSLLRGDRAYCSQVIKNELKNNPPIFELYEQLIRKSLYEIGELWENNEISTATEHLASAIIEAILNEIYPEVISSEKKDKSVVLTCVENERHQIGIKMVNDVFELNGWKTYFLGTNTPVESLIRFTKEIQPTLLAISVSLYFHLPDLERLILRLNSEFPELIICVGGQAFRHGGDKIISAYTNVVYLPDLNSLNQYLKKHN